MIEAQQMLLDIQVACFPNLKQEDQERIHRKLHREAYPEVYAKPVALTGKDLEDLLAGG